MKKILNKMKEKFNKNDNSKKVLSIFAILVLIVFVAGVTYAITAKDIFSNDNSITSGIVSMNFTESSNVITLNDAFPMTDDNGMVQSNYFDFSVTTNMTLNNGNPESDVSYKIIIEPMSTSGYIYNENATSEEKAQCQTFIINALNLTEETSSSATSLCNGEAVRFTSTKTMTIDEALNDPELRSQATDEQIEYLKSINIVEYIAGDLDDGYTALSDSQIKVYLENKDTNAVAKTPTLISDLTVSDDNIVLFSSKHTHSYGTNTITTNYRLRAWIDYDGVDVFDLKDVNYEYKFRVNIEGEVKYLDGSGASKTIIENNTVKTLATNFTTESIQNDTSLSGLYAYEEDGKTDYFYRGYVNNNWVKFGRVAAGGNCTYNGEGVWYYDEAEDEWIRSNKMTKAQCKSTNICDEGGYYDVGVSQSKCEDDWGGTWLDDTATYEYEKTCTYNGTPVYSDGETITEEDCVAQDVCYAAAYGGYFIGIPNDVCTSYGFEMVANAKLTMDISYQYFYWKIVRITSDGEIRMIYSGTTAPTEEYQYSVYEGSDSDIPYITYGPFSNTKSSGLSGAETVGYVYTEGEAHGTSTDSTIKTVLDNWYSSNLEEEFDSYISESNYCYDRSTYIGEVAGMNFTGTGYGTDNTLYAGAKRIYFDQKASLVCSNSNDIISSKIGLLSGDEASIAGIGMNDDEYNYLVVGESYWLGTPGYYMYDEPSNAVIYESYGVRSVTNYAYVRPVISLNPKVKVVEGTDGTYLHPYEFTLD